MTVKRYAPPMVILVISSNELILMITSTNNAAFDFLFTLRFSSNRGSIAPRFRDIDDIIFCGYNGQPPHVLPQIAGPFPCGI